MKGESRKSKTFQQCVIIILKFFFYKSSYFPNAFDCSRQADRKKSQNIFQLQLIINRKVIENSQEQKRLYKGAAEDIDLYQIFVSAFNQHIFQLSLQWNLI